jgi:hypothetical protein
MVGVETLRLLTLLLYSVTELKFVKVLMLFIPPMVLVKVNVLTYEVDVLVVDVLVDGLFPGVGEESPLPLPLPGMLLYSLL